MATMTRLATAQQRLVNTLFDTPYTQHRVDQLLPALHTEWDDIVFLVEAAKLVDARNEHGDAVPNLDCLQGSNLWPLWLDLTEAGRRWVLTDPTNRLLRAVDSGPGQRRNLDYAVRIAGDRETVQHAVVAGYLTVHEAESQREVALTDRSIRDFVFEGSRHFTVNATRKIRQVLG